MSNLAMSNPEAIEFPALVSWDEFQLLDDERLENGEHYELHNGEVVVVPPPRPKHVSVQLKLPLLLRFVEDFDFQVDKEFWYRPAMNYQWWQADIVVIPKSLQREMRDWDGWQVYSPPLIIEVLSPSDERQRKDRQTNTPQKISKQRIVAMSNGTREFWMVDAEKRTVHVTTSEGVKIYESGELIPCSLTTPLANAAGVPVKSVRVDEIFA